MQSLTERITDKWPRKRKCRRRICRRKFLSWGAALCLRCQAQRRSSRREKKCLRRLRPGKPISRGNSWREARKAVSGQPCAICGAPGGKSGTHPIDHIIAARFIQRNELGDANSSENLVALCAKCHPKKRRAEDRLCRRTNIVGWLQELNRIGFPMERVKKAMAFYGIKCVAA